MNPLILLSAVLFTIAAVIAAFVDNNVVLGLVLGGIAAYVAAGAGLPRVAH